jgi:hypothetical protein
MATSGAVGVHRPATGCVGAHDSAPEKTPGRGTSRGQSRMTLVNIAEDLMAVLKFARKMALTSILVSSPLVFGQASFVPQGAEYATAGALPGDQVWPHVSIKASGGYVVWQDNATDGSGWGASARRLDSNLSGALSSFRVNTMGAEDQERPQVCMLNDGGAVFVWQGGKQGYQRIFARFLAASGTWATADVRVNSFTNQFQLNPVVATLSNGNVVVVWGSFNQEGPGSMQGVYAQRLTEAGQKLGGEFAVNQFTPYNQRSATVTALSDGRFVIVWISEQQRFENSVDVYARVYDANGIPAGDEFRLNSDTNVCANPSVAPSADGGFMVSWMQKDLLVRSNSWDVFARPFSGNGFGGVTRRVNAHVYGDQLAPKISAIGSEYLVVWTSMAQDGSREGVFGQFLRGDGSLAGGEIRVNTTTLSQQMHPVLASDGAERFVVAWTSFAGGAASFDLYSQRYVSNLESPLPPDPPFVTVLSSDTLSVAWPELAGLGVRNCEVYADGAATPAAVVTNNWWTMTGLAPATTHSFRLAYVLTDGRRSPLSAATTNKTYGPITYSGIPVEWMSHHFGDNWPLATVDSDGDGASNRDEFLAGTDPTDASSVLRVRLDRTAQGLFLNWNTEPGLMYQVQTSPNLEDWTNFGGPRFAAGAMDSMFAGLGHAGHFRVLRLR